MTNLFHALDLLRARARAQITAFGRTQDQIRSDNTLSAYGKSDQLARAYVEVRRDVDALKRQEDDAIVAREVELKRRLFGWDGVAEDADVLSARRESSKLADALDDPRDALIAYETAKLRHDEMHVRAIFARALLAGWSPIVDDYLAQHPARTAEAQELASIVYLLSPEGQFMVSSQYFLSKPTELSSVDLTEYERELTAERGNVVTAFAAQLRAV